MNRRNPPSQGGPTFNTMLNTDEDKIVFYDIETDHQWAPYATLRIVGYQVGLDSSPKILDLNSVEERLEFKEMLASPHWTKVHFNGINFDEIVLSRYGFPTNPENRHDVYLMAKTCHPALPRYGLKFLNCYWFADWHEPERELRGWCTTHGQCPPDEAPVELQTAYCKYDVTQTVRLFKMYWPIVRQSNHWRAYTEVELPFGEVLHEMMLEGGDWVNVEQIEQKVRQLNLANQRLEDEARILSKGKITNPNSTKQVAEWINEFEKKLDVSEKGNLICRKEDLLTLLNLDDPKNDSSRIARICFEIRSNIKQLGYLGAFHRAAKHELQSDDNRRLYSERKCVKIPKSYSLSGARTRRFTSSSYFGINFQNEDKSTKSIELIPPGWLGVFIDETQIENVFHIYASKDIARRKAYENDTNYNEYVWLANRVLGTDYSKEELEKMPSSVNNQWSVYKQYKTCKLAMNFGMGVSLFAERNGLERQQARQVFEDIHKACPAIRTLQRWVENELITHKFVQDPFGHVYSGPVNQAYKVLAYFIQGCGTGSIPKVMARAIYDRLHSELALGSAVLCGTTHDEIAFRIRVADNSDVQIIKTIKGCLYDCEQRFSHLFDNIPLRAKLALSVTNAAEAEELNHYKLSPEEFESQILHYITMA